MPLSADPGFNLVGFASGTGVFSVYTETTKNELNLYLSVLFVFEFSINTSH